MLEAGVLVVMLLTPRDTRAHVNTRDVQGPGAQVSVPVVVPEAANILIISGAQILTGHKTQA